MTLAGGPASVRLVPVKSERIQLCIWMGSTCDSRRGARRTYRTILASVARACWGGGCPLPPAAGLTSGIADNHRRTGPSVYASQKPRWDTLAACRCRVDHLVGLAHTSPNCEMIFSATEGVE